MGKKIVSQIVDSDDDPEVKGLRDELEQEKAKLSILALKEFETQKADLLSKISDPQKREEIDELIQSEEDLKRVQTMVDVIQSGISYGLSPHDEKPKKTPSGQAKMWSPTSKQVEQWDGVEDMVNFVYDGLEEELFKKEMTGKYNAERLKRHQNMADRLLSSMIKGFQNRETANIGKFQVMRCRGCGKILTKNEDVCPVCNKRVMTGVQGGW